MTRMTCITSMPRYSLPKMHSSALHRRRMDSPALLGHSCIGVFGVGEGVEMRDGGSCRLTEQLRDFTECMQEYSRRCDVHRR